MYGLVLDAALNCCRQRTQGRRLTDKDPSSPQILITEHTDVKRILTGLSSGTTFSRHAHSPDSRGNYRHSGFGSSGQKSRHGGILSKLPDTTTAPCFFLESKNLNIEFNQTKGKLNSANEISSAGFISGFCRKANVRPIFMPASSSADFTSLLAGLKGRWGTGVSSAN